MNRAGHLRALLAIASEMLLAAQARDSETLADLDFRYQQHTDALSALPPSQPGDADGELIASLSQQVLQRQTEVESLIHPWMDDLRVLFREQRAERALAATYRNSA